MSLTRHQYEVLEALVAPGRRLYVQYSPRIGTHKVRCNGGDFPNNVRAATVDSLYNKGYIEQVLGPVSLGRAYKLTVAGWEVLEEYDDEHD